MSQIATSRALGTRDQASRWNCDTYPQPIKAPRNGGAALRMALPLRWLGVRVVGLDGADPELNSAQGPGSSHWSLVAGAEPGLHVLGRSPALAGPTRPHFEPSHE